MDQQKRISGLHNRVTRLALSQTAIVLAGGEGSRVGLVGRLLPKCMLPISSQDTLLSRLLAQLSESGVAQIVVSTSPEHYDLLRVFIKRVVGVLRFRAEVSLFCDSTHKFGPVPALAEAMRRHPSEAYVLGLADILFTESPFLRPVVDGDAGGTLIVSTLESGRGGVASTEHGRVCRLTYDAKRAVRANGEQVYNWTGAAYFTQRLAQHAIERGPAMIHRPLEELFNDAICTGHVLSYAQTGAFVNVNSFDDLLACQGHLRSLQDACSIGLQPARHEYAWCLAMFGKPASAS